MKYVWITAAILAAIVLIVVVVGYMLPVKHTASVETTYRTSPEKLFGLITDYQAFPTWRTGVTSVESIASTDGRTRFRETSKDGRIAYVVEAAEPNRKVITRIDDKKLPFGGTWTYAITPVDASTTTLRITEDGEVYNPIFRFVSRFLMGHDATIKTYMTDVAKRFPAS